MFLFYNCGYCDSVTAGADSNYELVTQKNQELAVQGQKMEIICTVWRCEYERILYSPQPWFPSLAIEMRALPVFLGCYKLLNIY